MADYWVCSECGNECEVVDISDDSSGDNPPEQRSDCCGALPEYRSQGDGYFDIDRDLGLDITDIDY